MGKQELKEELKLYKGVNEVLTSKICYLLMGGKDYTKARMIDGTLEDIVEIEIDTMKEELENTKNALYEHYSLKND